MIKRRQRRVGPERIGVLFIQSQTYFGSDSMIHSLIMTALDRRRFRVFAAVNRGTRWDPSASLPALRQVPDVTIRPTSFGTSVNFRTWGQRLRDTVVSGPRSLGSLVGLAIWARRERIGIVHCTEKPRDALYGYLVARAAGAKCIIHLHVKVNHEWMSPLTQFAMRHADGLLGVSAYIKQTALDNGYRPERCFAVVNAIDASRWDPATEGQTVRDEFGIAPGTAIISIISRVYSWKGHTELLQALARVTPEFDDYRLLLVGEDDIRAQPGHGSYLADLRAMVDELGLQDHVIFTGFRTDIRRLLAGTDIYAMPSFEEPCAVAYLEALAMKVPVVALRSGGTPQLVDDGESGLLSEPWDIEELATNLLRLLRDPKLRTRFGEHARHRVEAVYTPQRLAADVAGVYEEVLAAP